jgi:hypothetical protein
MSAVDQKRIQFERHEDDPWYDEVSIRTVERWKDSEMSGDEWRFSFVVEFKRKGEVLLSRGFGDFKYATAYLPALALNDHAGGADEEHQDARVLTNREDYCFQPGCAEAATREFRILKMFVPRMGIELPEDKYAEHRTRFCDRHAGSRGDCGLQDADCNYEEVPFGSQAGAPAVPRSAVYESRDGRTFLSCPEPSCDWTCNLWTGDGFESGMLAAGQREFRIHRLDHPFTVKDEIRT